MCLRQSAMHFNTRKFYTVNDTGRHFTHKKRESEKAKEFLKDTELVY